MNETENSDNGEQPQNNAFFRGGFYWIAVGALILSGVVIWLSRVFGQQTEQYSFIAQAVVNVLIFAAILVQALIYRRQWDAMRSGLAQNIRAIKAAEKSAKVAEDAFHVGEAPYLGIAKIAPEGFNDNYAPLIKISFTNGGKTPAWHVHSSARAVVGLTPENGRVYRLDTKWHDLENTFLRTGDTRTLEYQHGLFRYSPQLDQDLNNEKVFIFLIINLHYRDFRKVWHPREFRLMWDRQHTNFKDYDAEEHNCELCKKASKNISV
jgi:hypothetical protein